MELTESAKPPHSQADLLERAYVVVVVSEAAVPDAGHKGKALATATAAPRRRPRCCGFMRKLPNNRRPSEIVRAFSPMWFAAIMGTGIVALLIFNFPYPFQGQRAMVWFFYILNAVLLCIFTGITLLRILLFPGVWMRLMGHPVESMFLGAIPMGISMVVNGLVFLSDYNRDMMLQAAYVVWWITVTFSVLTACVVPFFMIVHQEHSMEKMTAVWLMPIVPPVVAANSGGLLAPFLPQGQAFVVLVTSYILYSLTMPLALGILVLLVHRLFVHKLPAVEVIMSCVLPVGPVAMGALALVNLGKACGSIINNPMFTFSTNVAHFATGAENLGIVLALLLDGYALWWFVLVVLLLSRTFMHASVPFSLSWWALTFPIGVLALAQLAIGNYLSYDPLLWLGSGLVWLVFAFWVLVFCKTLQGVWTGEIFVAPSLPAV